MRRISFTSVLKSGSDYRTSAVQCGTTQWSDRKLVEKERRKKRWGLQIGVEPSIQEGLRLGGRSVQIQKLALFELKPEKDKTFVTVSWH